VTYTLNKASFFNIKLTKARDSPKTLLTARKRSGRSHEEKQLLILLSSINIFELIEAKHLDYKMIDAIFGEHKILKASKTLVKLWATISSVCLNY
jgi:hypothetical protein